MVVMCDGKCEGESVDSHSEFAVVRWCLSDNVEPICPTGGHSLVSDSSANRHGFPLRSVINVG